MNDFVIVIPSRYASTRLPGKPLREIYGKTMLEHVWERASESRASETVIATDDERIAATAEKFGARVCMTGNQHGSGTERIAEVCDLMDWPDQKVVVNLQGDEPTMPAALIDQCAAALSDDSIDIATLASPLLSQQDFENPSVVKVVCANDGNAIYFSRASIPYARDTGREDTARNAALHHHGIYAYRCGVLRQLVVARPSKLEVCEQLEQLRALSLGMTIRVAVPDVRPGSGVDTEDDLAVAAEQLRRQAVEILE